MIDQVKLRAAETVKSFMIDMWLARHTPEKVLPLLHKVIESAKEEFADAIANGGGIYGVGYCFGAKYVLILGGEHPDTVAWGQTPKDEEQGVVKQEPLIKVGALAHGVDITKEDLEAVKVPIAMACVEHDSLFPDDVLDAGRKALERNKIEHEIQVYKDVPHGFAVLGDYEDRKIKDAQKQAFGQLLGWLQSH
jgi:dienelactone hydrolase